MKLCMGCMNEIDDAEVKCPVCGYIEEKQAESVFLPPGTILEGKYIVGRALGYHGYTVTYIGMDAEKNRKVWIHEYLPIDFSTRSGGESRVTIYSGDALAKFGQGLVFFLNEAANLERLGKVPGIIEVYECIAENDTGYVITEYLEGQTLKEQLDEGVHYSAEQAVEVIKYLLSGLSVLHEQGILHSNIAPDTIYMTSDGGAVLFEFGTARYETSENTKNLSALYKRGYTPEEQYRSIGIRTPSSDVYALAAVLYHMLTGHVPVESVARAFGDEMEEPSALGVGLPESVENALMNALNVHQSDRTETAGKFLEELNAVDTKRRLIKANKKTGKKGVLSLLAAGILVAAIGVFAFFAVQRLEKKESVDQAAVVDKSVKMPDLTKYISLEEATKAAEKNGIILEAEIIFSKEENGERIAAQSISAGTVLKDVAEKFKEGDKVKVSCTVITSRRAKYVDVRNWKASGYLFTPEKKEEITLLQVKKKPKSKPYGKVFELEMNDGQKITAEELLDEKNNEKILNLDDIKNIWQYTGDIYWIQAMRDYTGTYVQDISFQVDTYSAEGRKKIRRNKRKEVLPAKETYYSFSKEYGKGYIVSQMLKKGKKYRSDKTTGPLFEVVSKVIGYQTSDSQGLLKKLEEIKGIKVVKKGAGEVVKGIQIQHKKALDVKGKEVIFTEGDTITVLLEPAPTPTPAPTPVATKKPAETKKPAVTKKPAETKKPAATKKD